MMIISSLKKMKWFLLCCILLSVAACSGESDSHSSAANPIQSFRDIPGVTEEEIAAIEAFKTSGRNFTLGDIQSTESFLLPDGTYAGFGPKFADLLSEIYEIPFIMEFYDFDVLVDGLDSGAIDFTNELIIIPERQEKYHMSGPIAQRSIGLLFHSELGVSSLQDLNGLTAGTFQGGAAISLIAAAYPELELNIVEVPNKETQMAMLRNGELDIALGAATGIEFGKMGTGFVFRDDLLPLIYAPIALTTANSDLLPVISVMNKYIAAGGIDKLYQLYKEGEDEYKQMAFFESLTSEEQAYINDLGGKKVPIVLGTDTYPVSFYNTRYNEFQGVSIDVLAQVSRITGIEFEVINDNDASWGEILEMLRTGQAALISDLSITEERREFYTWLDTPFFTTEYMFISKADYPDLELYQIEQTTVGIVDWCSTHTVYNELFPDSNNIKLYYTQDEGLDALENDEIDLFFNLGYILIYQRNLREKPDYKANYVLPFYNDVFFGFNINEQILCSIIDKSIAHIDTEKISNNWINRTFDYRARIAEARLPWLVGAVILSLFALALVIIIFIFFYRNRKALVERAALRESEERMRILLNAAPIAIAMWDEDAKPYFVNETMVKLLKLSSKDECIERLYELTPEYQPDGRLSSEKGPAEAKKAFAEGYNRHEWVHKTTDGEIVPCEVTALRIDYKNHSDFATFTYDLREIRAAAEKIRETEEQRLTVEEANRRLQTILDMMPVGIILLREEDNALIYANEAALSMYFNEDVLGRDCLAFLPEYQPDGLRSADVLAQLWSYKNGVTEMQCVKPNGETFPAKITFQIINYNGEVVSLDVIEDITEEKKRQQTLEQIALREQEANQLKSRFLATVSHEIRTPMNAIIGMTELALREPASETVKSHILTIKQAGTNMLALLNDILDFSKIEAGKLEIIPVEYHLSSLLSDLISILRMRIDDSRIHFVIKADSNIPRTLYGDETRIRQALLNILSNAVKYTESGYVSFGIYGEIIDEDTIKLMFEVIDTGIGIKPEDIDKLFTDFTQLDLEKNRNIDGVGLGLAITHSIVEAMGGNITVQSEYGKGSTFTVTVTQKYHSHEKLATVDFPEEKSLLVYERNKVYADSIVYALRSLGVSYTLVKSGTELYEMMESNKHDYLFISLELYDKNEETIRKFKDNIKIALLSEMGEIAPQEELSVLAMPVCCTHIANLLNGVSADFSGSDGTSANKFFTADARVLVVDDIKTNLKVAEGLLVPYGIHVDLADSGAAAVEAVRKSSQGDAHNRYDLIFMDHKMPGMDGVEATRRIRELGKTTQGGAQSDSYYKDVPVIALTANAVSGMIEMFFDNGFNDFLPKPIDTVKLNTMLEKWIPKAKQVY